MFLKMKMLHLADWQYYSSWQCIGHLADGRCTSLRFPEFFLINQASIYACRVSRPGTAQHQPSYCIDGQTQGLMKHHSKPFPMTVLILARMNERKVCRTFLAAFCRSRSYEVTLWLLHWMRGLIATGICMIKKLLHKQSKERTNLTGSLPHAWLSIHLFACMCVCLPGLPCITASPL